jgi:hypothetical protein
VEKYQNKYRIPSARLQTWDYGSHAAYFITVCTQNRQHFFGEIVEGKMDCSSIGLMVEQEWTRTPGLRPDMSLGLGEYVVMPNHFHGIIIIGDNRYNTGDRHGRDAMHGVSTNTTNPTIASVPAINPTPTSAAPNTNNNIPIVPAIANQFGPQSKNLASIIRGLNLR